MAQNRNVKKPIINNNKKIINNAKNKPNVNQYNNGIKGKPPLKPQTINNINNQKKNIPSPGNNQNIKQPQPQNSNIVLKSPISPVTYNPYNNQEIKTLPIEEPIRHNNANIKLERENELNKKKAEINAITSESNNIIQNCEDKCMEFKKKHQKKFNNYNIKIQNLILKEKKYFKLKSITQNKINKHFIKLENLKNDYQMNYNKNNDKLDQLLNNGGQSEDKDEINKLKIFLTKLKYNFENNERKLLVKLYADKDLSLKQEHKIKKINKKKEKIEQKKIKLNEKLKKKLDKQHKIIEDTIKTTGKLINEKQEEIKNLEHLVNTII